MTHFSSLHSLDVGFVDQAADFISSNTPFIISFSIFLIFMAKTVQLLVMIIKIFSTILFYPGLFLASNYFLHPVIQTQICPKFIIFWLDFYSVSLSAIASQLVSGEAFFQQVFELLNSFGLMIILAYHLLLHLCAVALLYQRLKKCLKYQEA